MHLEFRSEGDAVISPTAPAMVETSPDRCFSPVAAVAAAVHFSIR